MMCIKRRLTYQRAEQIAKDYMWIKARGRRMIRTKDFFSSSRSKGYRQFFKSLEILEENGLLESRTVGVSGRIWLILENCKP